MPGQNGHHLRQVEQETILLRHKSLSYTCAAVCSLLPRAQGFTSKRAVREQGPLCARGDDPRALFALNAALKELGVLWTISQIFKHWGAMPIESTFHSGPAPHSCSGSLQPAATAVFLSSSARPVPPQEDGWHVHGQAGPRAHKLLPSLQ